jgi:tetratricopeptide (TPR) repeat protein/TolB-like protein
MGEVYRARDTDLEREVAVKVLPEAVSGDPDRLERFKREARAVAALSHPNIMEIFDVGSESKIRFAVTELLEGQTLRQRIPPSGLPWQKVVEMGACIADGLAAAHGKGIVHRDLKPENVFVTSDGRVKVLDFGLARMRTAVNGEADTATLTPAGTQTGTILGTVGYMSPEQVRGKPSDARSDIFALGCVLYEMVSGARAFGGDTTMEAMAAILKEEPPQLSSSGATVPADLERAIHRCLEKSPEARFQSTADLAYSLKSIGTGPAVVMATPTGEVRPPYTTKKKRWPFVAAAAAVALAVIAIVLFMRQASESPVRSEPAAELDPKRVVAAAFENRSGDPSLDPIAALTADAVTQGLVELGEVEVVPVPDGGSSGDDAALRAAARAAEAGTVVSGSIYVTGGTLELWARVIDTASGKPIYALKPERGPRGEPDKVIDRVRQRVMGALQLHLRPAPFLGGLTTPPLHSAYLECVAGLGALGVNNRAAVQHLERAAELDPEFWHPQIHILLAYGFVRDKARIEAMQRHLRENQDRFGPADRIAMQHYEARLERRPLEALRSARRLLAMAPRDFGWTLIAATLALDLNRPREALEHIGEVEKFDWDTLSAWIQGSWMISTAALAHHLLGGHEAELEVVRFGLGLYPDSLDLPQDHVRALAGLGRVIEIDQVIREALVVRTATDTPGEVILTAAQELRAHAYSEDARRVAATGADWYAGRTGEEASPLSIPLNRVECLWLAERFEEARALAEQAFETRPTDLWAQGYRGIVAARVGDRTVADAMDRQLAASENPRRRGNASYLRACIAAQRGERERAMELLREALAHRFGARGYLHVYAFLEPLHGYPPFEELLRPKG